MNNSLVVRSIGRYFIFDAVIPKVTLNQHFENPIKPKKLHVNISKKQERGEISNKPTKI